ncbi:hypothetical protein [Methylobacterium ajmalii]|uniref:hypothetical protein n=1 Tax=Methylobacterium ajmalii TaxID=2738439 RepID=UPI002F3424E8
MATSAGLVSVTTGSFVVSGTLTSFVAAEGDQLVLRGITALISRAISPSQLQLKQAWPGPDITGASDWDISLTGPYWNQSTTTNLRLSQLLAQFEAGPIKWDVAGPPSDRAKYNDQGVGFVFLSLGDPWTLYTKIANTGQASDWSAGQEIKGSPAESTVEAQAARDDAILSADRASTASGAATSAASSAAGSASGAAGSAGMAALSARDAQASAGTAASQAAAASSGATEATNQAATALAQASAAAAARQAAEAARDLALPAASTAQAAASATAQDRAQTGNDRDVSGFAVSLTQAARDAAAAAAADARSYAAQLQTAAYDWSFDGSPDPSNDWSS